MGPTCNGHSGPIFPFLGIPRFNGKERNYEEVLQELTVGVSELPLPGTPYS